MTKIKVKVHTNGISEARCAVAHFLKASKTDFHTVSRGAFTVDIGGGTTDIAFWNKDILEWEDSVKFAGGDLIASANYLTEFVRDKAKNDQFEYESCMRMWPFVHPTWNREMEAFCKDERSLKVIRTIALFYGAISFYLGLHIRRTSQPFPDRIAFAGNGIRFLSIINQGVELNQNTLGPWIKFLGNMIVAGAGRTGQCATGFDFSHEPKLEVAKGLVSPMVEKFKESEMDSSKKMLGLEIVLPDGKTYSYDGWLTNPAKEIASAEFNFEILKNFLTTFAKEAQLLEPKWQVSLSPSDLNDVIKNKLLRRLQIRGDQELANSLFFEAVDIWMKHQYDNL